jgi:hypothetical protein
MKFLKAALLAIAVTVVGVIAFGVGLVNAQSPELPSSPPWVRDNGIIDLSKLPECFEVVGPDGQTVRDERGRNVCIPSEQLFAPPAFVPTAEELRNQNVLSNQDGTTVVEMPLRRPNLDNP